MGALVSTAYPICSHHFVQRFSTNHVCVVCAPQVVWFVIVSATQSTTEIRIKTLSWPFLVLWLMAWSGGARQLPWVLLGVLVWCYIGTLVRRYEQREMARVEQLHVAPGQGRAQRQQAGRARAPLRPSGPARAVVFTEQTECPICLESLSLTPEGKALPPDGVGMLPCNHRFHTECIQPWLARESRCPTCRQSARGIDRVLEVVF